MIRLTLTLLLLICPSVLAGLCDCTPERIAWLDSAEAWADSVDSAGYAEAEWFNRMELLECQGEMLEDISHLTEVVKDINSVPECRTFTWIEQWKVVGKEETVWKMTYEPLYRVYVFCHVGTKDERIWRIAR